MLRVDSETCIHTHAHTCMHTNIHGRKRETDARARERDTERKGHLLERDTGERERAHLFDHFELKKKERILRLLKQPPYPEARLVES